jgi:hypothetical protein
MDRSALMSCYQQNQNDHGEDRDRDLDHKINEKMSEGLKKVASLVIAKFDNVLE